MSSRHKFQFSNATAQRAEALLNAKETQALLARRVPKHLQENEASTPAGKCFRNVSAILAGVKR